MPLDPQAREFLDKVAALNAPGWSEMPPEEGRKVFASLTDNFGEVEQVFGVRDVRISSEVIARAYTPNEPGPFPAVMYFHGGGWVLGDRETHDALCRRLANRCGCVVVSVDYRLSPENRFPAPLQDCFAATCHVAENAADFQVDSTRLAVAGDSAGGNLATAVALMARDQGGPDIRFQLLIYPVIQPNFETPSYCECAEGFGLTRETMIWFWKQYLAIDDDALNPYAVPMLADNLQGLPPAHVITAEYDVLRDEGEAYAARLVQDGVATTTRRYDGMIHGFVHSAGVFDMGLQSTDDMAKLLRAALCE